MFDPTTLVGFHTWLSLVAIATGLFVVADLIAARERGAATIAFLATDGGGYITGTTVVVDGGADAWGQGHAPPPLEPGVPPRAERS